MAVPDLCSEILVSSLRRGSGTYCSASYQLSRIKMRLLLHDAKTPIWFDSWDSTPLRDAGTPQSVLPNFASRGLIWTLYPLPWNHFLPFFSPWIFCDFHCPFSCSFLQLSLPMQLIMLVNSWTTKRLDNTINRHILD